MKRSKVRLAAAAVTGALICGAGVVPSAADPSRVLDQQACVSYTATPAAELGDAWQLDRLDMDAMWRLATGKGIKVAVIDTGVSTLGSPYFSAGEQRVVARDMIPASANTSDDGSIDCAHGTAVTSIIAAGRGADGNALGTATNFSGIAPEATIYAYRALMASQPSQDQASDDKEDLSYTIEAVREAIADDVDIINLSLVTYSDPKLAEFGAAIQEAIDAGIVVVAAAGNADTQQTGAPYPAAFPGVISVGMSNRADAGDRGTHMSRAITIGAPGRDLTALRPSHEGQTVSLENQSYVTNATGTSYAAPIVSGVVALMLQYQRQYDPSQALTPVQIRERLIATADRPPVKAPDPFIGYGIINPMRAISNLEAGTGSTASPTPTVHSVTPPDTTHRTPLSAMVALGMGIGAVALVLLGLVAALAIPAARRRSRP